jgi:hypothetical protein
MTSCVLHSVKSNWLMPLPQFITFNPYHQSRLPAPLFLSFLSLFSCSRESGKISDLYDIWIPWPGFETLSTCVGHLRYTFYYWNSLTTETLDFKFFTVPKNTDTKKKSERDVKNKMSADRCMFLFYSITYDILSRILQIKNKNKIR